MQFLSSAIIFVGKMIVPFSFFILVSSAHPIQTINTTFFPTATPTTTMTPTPTLTPTPSITPSPKPTTTPTPTPVPVSGNQLDTWFTQYSNHYSIDRDKLWRVAVCESGLRPNAINGPYAGLFQFSSSTWASTRKTMGMDSNIDLRFSPEEAIKTAAFKISTSGLSAWPNCGVK